jgi:aerobic carbon-monoxide dehydrogenase medium subunit
LIAPFELSRPEHLDDALRLVAEGAVPLVGGTELVAAMNLGLIAPERVVDLKRVTALNGITVEADVLRIGATTRHDDVARSALVARTAPILAQACSVLGNQRVRATGTVGGNLCFADHRSDVATALFALRAEVSLRSSDGGRSLPVEDFLLGAMDTDLDGTEVMESISVPETPGPQVYLRHQPNEYPTVCVAVVQSEGEGGRRVRMAIGAVAERPVVVEAERLDDLDVAAAMAGADVVEDLTGSEDYKQHLASVFAGRAIAKLKEITGD